MILCARLKVGKDFGTTICGRQALPGHSVCFDCAEELRIDTGPGPSDAESRFDQNSYSEGYNEGHSDGYAAGHEDGMTRARAEAKAQTEEEE